MDSDNLVVGSNDTNNNHDDARDGLLRNSNFEDFADFTRIVSSDESQWSLWKKSQKTQPPFRYVALGP